MDLAKFMDFFTASYCCTNEKNVTLYEVKYVNNCEKYIFYSNGKHMIIIFNIVKRKRVITEILKSMTHICHIVMTFKIII